MILTKQLHAMRAVRVKDDPIFKVSPGIQGSNAYDLLTFDQKGHLKAALEDASKTLKADKKDLEWRFDGFAFHVRKKPRVEINAVQRKKEGP